MKLKSLVAGIVGAFAISGAAYAADPIFIPPPAPPPPVAVAPAGFNWGGIYAGAGILTATTGGGIAFDGHVGFNIDNGGLVFGAEAVVIPIGGGVVFGAFGKVGFALGASRNILLYGTGGALFTGGTAFLVGGGAAVGLGQNLSIYAEGLAVPGAGCCIIRAGVNFHFGN